MRKRPLFRLVALERFLGPFPTDAPLRIVQPHRALVILALAILGGCALIWLV